MTAIDQVLKGKEIPESIKDSLVLIDVPYFSFEGKSQTGQMVVHKDLVKEILEIFQFIAEKKFPIAKIIPVCEYDWSDEKSMAGNNTSAFNYREIYGTNRLSNHSYGWAIDINPLLNPFLAKDGSVHPAGATYNPETPGTIAGGGPVVNIFEKLGWQWGGRWKSPIDWQHFEKPLLK